MLSAESNLRCKKCKEKLHSVKTWTNIIMHCKACNAEYSVTDVAEMIDDAFEEQMARVPLDRL